MYRARNLVSLGLITLTSLSGCGVDKRGEQGPATGGTAGASASPAACAGGVCTNSGGAGGSGAVGTGGVAGLGGSGGAGAGDGGGAGVPYGGAGTGGAQSGGTFTGGVEGDSGGTFTGGVQGHSGGAPAGGVGAGGQSGGTSSGGAPVGGAGTGGSGAVFRNPLNTTQGSDPFMIYHEGYYYLAATTWGTTLTMKRGRTIQELKEASPATIWTDGTASRCCNMWAPEFYLLDGPNGRRWYHYYTAGDGADLGTQRSHVLESEGTDPMGPYHYQGQLLNYWAIDGSVLVVGGNRHFLFSTWEGGTQNVYVIAMSDPWTVTGNRTRLTAPTYAWEQEGSDSVNEGPTALYRGGRTFLTYSASQCADPGYKLGLLELTGSNPLDAGAWWKSPSPVFQTANGAYGPGHNGFMKSPNGSEDFLVYHATGNPNGSCWTDRTTRIQRVAWNADGRPDFGVPLALSTDIPVPSGE